MEEKEKIKLERSRAQFMAKVLQLPNGCWHWTGAKYVNGKGLVRRNGKNWLAHRLSYALFVAEPEGVLSDNVDVRHSCTDTFCINPAHLFERAGSKSSPVVIRESEGEIVEKALQKARPGQAFWDFRAGRPKGESMADTRKAWEARQLEGMK